MKTKSLWGSPPGRFYGFLKRVEMSFHGRPVTIAILGCADGKYVLPCARKGYQVLAVDTDRVALFGPLLPEGRRTASGSGLVQRLKQEGLEKRVAVFCEDIFSFSPAKRCHAVFCSGAINYLHNARYSLSNLIELMSKYVEAGGFAYFDYMLPMEENGKKKMHYFAVGELCFNFRAFGWNVLYDRVLPPQLEKPHAGSPIDHYHRWGHICVQKPT